MGNSPRYVGFIDPTYNVTLIDDSGAALDLTGCVSANFTLTMIKSGTSLAQQGNGTWTIANQTTNKGQASYQWTLNDMATAGSWLVYTTVKLPSEAGPREFDPELIEILFGTVGAGAAPPGVLPNPAATLPFLNIRDFGGVGDGVSDNTIPIANARAAARALGGARILLGPGTYLTGNQDISIDHGVYHVGSGVGTTIIKLKNGANTDLFSGQIGLIDITDGNLTGPTGTLYDFGFSNMTLDGNKANQSSTSYCLRFYGLSYRMENLEIRNAYSDGVLTNWRGFNNYDPADSMEAFWSNIKIHDNGGRGLLNAGPHDSVFINCDFYMNASHQLHITPPGGSAVFTNLHTWTNRNVISPQITYQRDTFARADQSGLGTASDGGTYTTTQIFPTMTASIASNKAVFSGANTEAMYILGSRVQADGQWTIQETLGGDAAGGMVLAWHCQNASNYYKFSYYAGVFYLQKTVAGADTTLAQFTPSFAVDPTNTLLQLRVQQQGTTIKAKAWIVGQIESPTWNVTATDSTFASGTSGFIALTNGNSHPTAQNFYVQSIPVLSNTLSILQEADGCLYSNCTAETSDTVQIAILGWSTVWDGGLIFDGLATPNFSTGIKLGQQAGETPYPGQVYQSGGLTTAKGASTSRINTTIRTCQGDNGALWLDLDWGGNTFDLTIYAGLKGTDVTGALSASSELRTNYDDGTNTSTSKLLLNSGVTLNKSGTMYSGSGVPASTLGNNGDFYFRIDTPGTANQRLYVKSAGAWIGIV